MHSGDLQDFLMMSTETMELPKVQVPEYKTGQVGVWNVIKNDVLRPIRGYFNGHQMAENNYVLIKNDGATPEVWMSLTPMELESHAPHIARAHGKVVIGGLGLGMYLYNVLQKDDVTEVVVIEKDLSIIKMFSETMVDDGWKELADEKNLRIICDDIITPTNPDTKEHATEADYLYVDIWKLMCDDQAIVDMPKIVKWAQPKECGWWCMEMDYIMILKDLEVGCLHIDTPNVEYAEEAFHERYGLPCQMSELDDYPKMLQAFVMQMIHQL